MSPTLARGISARRRDGWKIAEVGSYVQSQLAAMKIVNYGRRQPDAQATERESGESLNIDPSLARPANSRGPMFRAER